ncbi:MAG: ferrous iron transport protein B, partial [Bacteroidales bacterium]|nr:ferrous iron transport protein B [Bacteroidales bacterium]
MHLSELKTGESGIIIKVLGHGGFRRRILEMGFVKGQKVTSLLNAPLRDPIKYKIMDYEVSLRRSEAAMIEIVPYTKENILANEQRPSGKVESIDVEEMVSSKYNEINVALVGNPNSGKTSLFNALSGSHEHVGNYSGVTVDAKLGHFKYKGYKINITDLPGTYALTAYSPEEIYVRRYLLEKTPDIILNSVVASNLERNLYLTSELIDINQKTVIALNMYDELEKSGAQLDYNGLAKLVGIPMVPVVAREKKGLDKLLDTIIAVYENTTSGKNTTFAKPATEADKGKDPDVSEIIRHIHIKYSPVIEKEIATISKEIKANDEVFPKAFPHRYWSVKLLEGDREIETILRKTPEYTKWISMREASVERIKRQLGEDVETAISDEKYGFISGALRETYRPGNNEQKKATTIIDTIVTHKLFSFPIFLLLLWIMFNATFTLGAYPQEWIEIGVGLFGEFVSGLLPEGALKDLIVNGIIAGVGSVIVFLPNILILYLFISLMEDSGYMARAAFIMDKLMHKMGLHGKSFIPMIMGFGCNVPAIMSTRTIESKSSRFITILINPFISCSARLPVYILLAGIFFPENSGTVLMMLYLLGIAVAIITAKLLRKFLFKEDETPFVMELPPYRVPTLNATLVHLWEKCAQYLRKIGSVILFASIIIWFLGYYPHPDSQSTTPTQQKGSYLEQVGKFCEPALEPLGLNWKAGVALVSGAAAKEIIVSTLGVLYSDEQNLNEEQEEIHIKEQILKSGDYTPASALSFMVFALLYFPCIATLATISNETGSWKWAFFSFLYSCSIAWGLSFVIYNIANLF